MAGFIKLYRDIRKWEWYTDIPVRVLFEHCLLCANHESAKWRGILINRGSFITSLAQLASETGLTIKQVRVAIDKLKKTHEMACEGHSQYSIITIKNWDLYQTKDMPGGKQRASERQAEGMQRAANKNEKNEENNRESTRARDKRYIENDPYLSENVQTFIETYKKEVKKRCILSPDERLKLLNILNDFIIQGLTAEEVSQTVCANFLKIDSRNDFGINWLLKDDNFYSIFNGEWQKKELPKDAADTGSGFKYKKTDANMSAVVDFLQKKGIKPKNEH